MASETAAPPLMDIVSDKPHSSNMTATEQPTSKSNQPLNGNEAPKPNLTVSKPSTTTAVSASPAKSSRSKKGSAASNKQSASKTASAQHAKEEQENKEKDPTRQGKGKDLSHVPCRFFKMGMCAAGDNCVFSHDMSECKYTTSSIALSDCAYIGGTVS